MSITTEQLAELEEADMLHAEWPNDNRPDSYKESEALIRMHLPALIAAARERSKMAEALQGLADADIINDKPMRSGGAGWTKRYDDHDAKVFAFQVLKGLPETRKPFFELNQDLLQDRDQWKARAEECENLLRHTLPILRKDFPETTRQITAIQIEDCLMKTAIQRDGQPPPGCDFPDLTEYKIMTRNPKDSPSID